ncbi:MAG TPA: alpha/beta fold hydrolase [Myxococcota bacterium]|nr:alpha/beta fold hydrolase [Myxococcota bacterium]
MIVILHGANGCGAEMEPLAAALRPFGEVRAPNLPGHGGRPLPPRMSIEDAADDVLASLGRDGVERAFFVGYSLGGYLALYLARRFPERVLGSCALATKFRFDPATVKHWTYLAQPERLRRPGNPRAAQLDRAHAPQDWTPITLANARLFEELGRAPPLTDADLEAIARPVLLVNSNRDRLVAWAETLDLGRRIPGARLVMFYGLAHPLARVPVHPVGRAIGAWMREVAPPASSADAPAATGT